MLYPSVSTTLIAVIDRIIPADDYPSASQAGVENYIQRMLATDLKSWAMIFYSCITSISQEAIARFGNSFEQLSVVQQDHILEMLDAGDRPFAERTVAWAMEPADFFRSLVRLVSEGYYSDPGNGGNRGEISWKMIGF